MNEVWGMKYKVCDGILYTIRHSSYVIQSQRGAI
jgi:hypothetical protein